MHYLFSYGTLQLEKVQIESFGRKLIGHKDFLSGYILASLKITDNTVLAKSEQEFHPIAVPTNKEEDKIEGTLYEISEEELQQADSYEVEDYKRIEVTFMSGKTGWVYIKS